MSKEIVECSKVDSCFLENALGRPVRTVSEVAVVFKLF